MPRKSAHMLRANKHTIVIDGKPCKIIKIVPLPSGSLEIHAGDRVITRTPGAKIEVV